MPTVAISLKVGWTEDEILCVELILFERALLEVHLAEYQTYIGAELDTAASPANRYGAGFPAQAQQDSTLWVGYTVPEYIEYGKSISPDCQVTPNSYKILAMTIFEDGTVDAWTIDNNTRQPKPLTIQ